MRESRKMREREGKGAREKKKKEEGRKRDGELGNIKININNMDSMKDW